MKPQLKKENNKKLRTIKEIAKIKYELHIKGFKQIDIAKALGTNESNISNVINGRHKSSRVSEWLEKNLGLELKYE